MMYATTVLVAGLAACGSFEFIFFGGEGDVFMIGLALSTAYRLDHQSGKLSLSNHAVFDSTCAGYFKHFETIMNTVDQGTATASGRKDWPDFSQATISNLSTRFNV